MFLVQLMMALWVWEGADHHLLMQWASPYQQGPLGAAQIVILHPAVWELLHQEAEINLVFIGSIFEKERNHTTETNLFLPLSNLGIRIVQFCHDKSSIIFDIIELQWLEHLWNRKNMFQTGIVQAREC